MPRNEIQGMNGEHLRQNDNAISRALARDPLPRIPSDFGPATFEKYQVISQVTHDHALKQLAEARQEVEDLKAELQDVKAHYEKKLKGRK